MACGVTSPNALPPADAALMRLVAEMDISAFETLYDRYANVAFGLAMSITRDRGSAEEATQDAFLSLWRSAARYDPSRGSAKTWLLSAVRNRAIDLLRRGSRRPQVVPIDASRVPEIPSPVRTDGQAGTRIEAERIRSLILELPTTQRAAIQLAYYCGLTQKEIANQLKLPLGTIKGRQRLGLAKLHRALIAYASS